MGMTITEKILAQCSGSKEVKPGEIVIAKIDCVLANDITGAIAIPEMQKMGYNEVFDSEKVVFVMDHFVPNANIKAAEQCKICREFARNTKLKNFYDVGKMGIEHLLLPEKGHVTPGDLVIGGDSHTCTHGAIGAFATGVGSTDLAVAMGKGELWLRVPESIKFIYQGGLPQYISGKDLILHTIGMIGLDGALYKAMEFTGQTLAELSLDDKFTMCNMAVEAGAKNGIIAPDTETLEYVNSRTKRHFNVYRSDENAEYDRIIEINTASLEPQVALPHLPSNVKNVSELSNIAIDQVVIGSCTNGRISDLRLAANLLSGKKIHPYVRVIVIPGSQEVYRQALKENLIDLFIKAGAAVSTPTCGPCFGGHMGILAKGERCLSTTNRNFAGRMGHQKSEVYLASPAVAAATAIKGYISNPWEVM